MNARTLNLGGGAAATAALAFAFVLQWGFALPPCHLCVLARWPYVAAIALAALAFALRRERAFLPLVALAILASAAVSLRHVGIEQGFIPLPDSCQAATGLDAGSVEDLMAALDAAPPPCDRITASFLGVSLAAWNALFALGLGLGLLVAWRRTAS